jgi:hypothetical protein
MFGKNKDNEKNPLISINIGEINYFQEPECHRQNVKLVLQTTINQYKITFMALQLTQGFFSLDQLALIDTDTNAQVQATFANTQPFASDNPAVLTSTPDPSSPSDLNKVKNTAVAGGTANVTTTTDATYTDSVSKQSVTKTLKLSIPYSVIAVVAGENVALTLIQGTPTAIPAP